jgi:hypothetical protein
VDEPLFAKQVFNRQDKLNRELTGGFGFDLQSPKQDTSISWGQNFIFDWSSNVGKAQQPCQARKSVSHGL